MRCKQFARCSESYDPNDDQVICKITAINEKTIIFEPDAASDSIRLESRYGIYSASLSIDGTKFDEISLMEQEDVNFQHFESFFHEKKLHLPFSAKILHHYFLMPFNWITFSANPFILAKKNVLIRGELHVVYSGLDTVEGGIKYVRCCWGRRYETRLPHSNRLFFSVTFWTHTVASEDLGIMLNSTRQSNCWRCSQT